MHPGAEAHAPDTRTKLILTAEQLFGERGIDAVPLREIVAAAGQRNQSALNYHIGGREDLVRAILFLRRSAVDARRVELLDEFQAACLPMDEAAIAAGIILPLVELMRDDPRGGNYLRFLSQIYITDRPESAYSAAGELDRGMRRCARLFRARHPDAGYRPLRERFAACGRGAIYALADWQRDTAACRASVPRSSLESFASDLITITASGLASIDRPGFAAIAAGKARGLERVAGCRSRLQTATSRTCREQGRR